MEMRRGGGQGRRAGVGEGGGGACEEGKLGEEEGEMPLLPNANTYTFCSRRIIWFCQINKGRKWR